MLTQEEINQIQHLLEKWLNQKRRVDDELYAIRRRFPKSIVDDEPGCDPYRRLVFLDLLSSADSEWHNCDASYNAVCYVLKILGYKAFETFNKDTQIYNVKIYKKQEEANGI